MGEPCIYKVSKPCNSKVFHRIQVGIKRDEHFVNYSTRQVYNTFVPTKTTWDKEKNEPENWKKTSAPYMLSNHSIIKHYH